jgi:hypothetical protein
MNQRGATAQHDGSKAETLAALRPLHTLRAGRGV